MLFHAAYRCLAGYDLIFNQSVHFQVIIRLIVSAPPYTITTTIANTTTTTTTTTTITTTTTVTTTTTTITTTSTPTTITTIMKTKPLRQYKPTEKNHS